MAVRCSLVPPFRFCFLRVVSCGWLLSRRVDDLFSVFSSEKKKTSCLSSSSSRRTKAPIPRRNNLGRRPKFYRRRRVAEKNSIQSSSSFCNRSLFLSLSLYAFVLEMCVCQKKTNADWLFFCSLFNQYSDDGNVINDQQRRRCFLGEVVLQKKSSKCNDDEQQKR